MRIATSSDMIPALVTAGYKVYPAKRESQTSIVEIPVSSNCSRSRRQVSMWEQLALAALMQKHWSDNSVSVTINFDPVTEGPQIKYALEFAQYNLKSVSFLPNADGLYDDMPESAITEQEYKNYLVTIRPIDWTAAKTEVVAERFCDSDKCSV
jgi:ribonucleoside-triphosphate reductase